MMGQEKTEKLIHQLKFTTLEELRSLIDEDDMGTPALTNALSKLNKHNEIITFKISRQTIYLCPEFYNQIGITQ